MAKIIRPNKDMPIFGSGAAAADLKIFGDATQSTDITLLLTNANSIDGWGSGVDANGFPALSWFNAVGHTLSYITSYYLQKGIAEWVTLQEYHIGSQAVASDGFTYTSKTNNNTGNTPVGDSTNWRLSFLDSANTVSFIPTANYHPSTKKYVDDSVAAISTIGILSTNNLFHIQDQKPSGVDGGTFTSGTWQDRDFNTALVNNITGASFDSVLRTFELPAGSFIILADAPATGVDGHSARIKNITDTIQYGGTSGFNNSADSYSNGTSIVTTPVFTIASPKTFKLQHLCGVSRTAIGFGRASVVADEIYSNIRIWKVG